MKVRTRHSRKNNTEKRQRIVADYKKVYKNADNSLLIRRHAYAASLFPLTLRVLGGIEGTSQPR